MKEIWRSLSSYRNLVSNLGRVRGVTGIIMKQGLSQWGYRYLQITRCDGGKKMAYVQDLVAEAFLGPKPSGKEVNHKDTIKTNNRWDNLEYLTHQQNIQHAAKNGLMPHGSNHHSAKLSEEKVRKIRRQVTVGKAVPKLAKEYQVSEGAIRHMLSGLTWKHVRSA